MNNVNIQTEVVLKVVEFEKFLSNLKDEEISDALDSTLALLQLKINSFREKNTTIFSS